MTLVNSLWEMETWQTLKSSSKTCSKEWEMHNLKIQIWKIHSYLPAIKCSKTLSKYQKKSLKLKQLQKKVQLVEWVASQEWRAWTIQTLWICWILLQRICYQEMDRIKIKLWKTFSESFLAFWRILKIVKKWRVHLNL